LKKYLPAFSIILLAFWYSSSGSIFAMVFMKNEDGMVERKGPEKMPYFREV
jgi:hypothetical protein